MRIKSGKLPLHSPPNSADNFDWTSLENDVSRTESHGEETNQRTKERRKKSQKRKAGRKQAEHYKLSMMLEMPYDIIFEILSLLTPKDLLSMTRANRALREMLTSVQSRHIWRVSRASFGMPECPKDIPDASWANLFFSSRCQECGSVFGKHLQPVFCRRVCLNCARSQRVIELRLCVLANRISSIFSEVAFEDLFPGMDPIIMDLIPYSNTGSSAPFYPRNHKRYFWDTSVYKMSEQLSNLQKAVHMQQPSARHALKNFKAEATRSAKEVMKVSFRESTCPTVIKNHHSDIQRSREIEIFSINAAVLQESELRQIRLMRFDW